jgi:bacteriocin biosynthesis cyclodehydratase domain-containing protein
MTIIEDKSAHIKPLATSRRWLVAPGARALVENESILVRNGDIIVRCNGVGLQQFLTELVRHMVDGAINPSIFSDLNEEEHAKVSVIIDHLVEAGLLVEDYGGLSSDPAVLSIWQRSGKRDTRKEIAERLQSRLVSLIGTGSLVNLIRQELMKMGIQVSVNNDTELKVKDCALAIVVAGHEEDSLLDRWNAHALSSENLTPWLAVIPSDGVRALVGPYVVPGQSACYRCYRLRRASTFPDRAIGEALAQAQWLGPAIDSSLENPGISGIQAFLVVDRVIEALSMGVVSPQLMPGSLITVDAESVGPVINHHRVLRVPRCPECSPGRGQGFPQVWFNTTKSEVESNQ